MSTERDTLSRDKKPSPELFEMIQAAASSLTGFAQLWESIRKKGNSEGFTDEQLQWLLRPLLQNKLKMSNDKIYYLFHKEEKAEANKEAYDKRRINKEIVEKKEPEQSFDPEEEIKKIGEIRRAEQKRQAEEPIIPDDEDPKDLEIQFLKEKVAELEDALKKTEQFKPATALQPPPITNPRQDEHYFKFLTDRADGVSSFYYDSYGIDLFKNRELSQLKNSGVKVFKRLYFEV